MDSALFNIAHNAIERTATTIMEAAQRISDVGDSFDAPHVRMKPRVFLEKPGHWCCIYGDNLATDPAGFGDSPSAACSDFDRRWKWSQQQIDLADAKKK